MELFLQCHLEAQCLLLVILTLSELGLITGHLKIKNKQNNMKKILLSVIVIAIGITMAQAQKLYATKTGQLKFNATGGVEAIAAINNQVDSKLVDKSGQLVFSVLIKGFKFDNQL